MEKAELEAKLAKAEHMLRIRTRQLTNSNEFWCRAGEKALAGDPRDLRMRVEGHRAPYMEVVLSAPSQQ